MPPSLEQIVAWLRVKGWLLVLTAFAVTVGAVAVRRGWRLPGAAVTTPILKVRLYQRGGDRVVRYHQAWIEGNQIIEYEGELGERGRTSSHAKNPAEDERANVERVLARARQAGFEEIGLDQQRSIGVLYSCPPHDEQQVVAAQDLLGDALDRVGVGHTGGTSLFLHKAAANFFVVDFELARRIIEKSLRATPFAGYETIADTTEIGLRERPPPAVSATGQDERSIGYDRAKAHPLAAQRLVEDFFWDAVDEGAPHGNDDGSDALSSFLEWRPGHARQPVLPFLIEQLREYDFELGRNDVDIVKQEDVTALFRRLSSLQRTLLVARDQVIVGVAFAQAKVEGKIDADVLQRARRATKRQMAIEQARLEGKADGLADPDGTRQIERVAAVLEMDWSTGQ